MGENRWKYGDTNPVLAEVDAETVIEIGDFVYQEVAKGIPTFDVTGFKDKFLGVTEAAKVTRARKPENKITYLKSTLRGQLVESGFCEEKEQRERWGTTFGPAIRAVIQHFAENETLVSPATRTPTADEESTPRGPVAESVSSEERERQTPYVPIGPAARAAMRQAAEQKRNFQPPQPTPENPLPKE